MATIRSGSTEFQRIYVCEVNTTHDNNSIPPLSRRDALRRMGAGFGSISLASLLAQSDSAIAANVSPTSPLTPRPAHFPAKAKHVIQLFMPGGPSQVDTFDYKPELEKFAGQRPELVNRKSLRNTTNGLMPSPYQFQQYGESGKWVSEIFPQVGEMVDDICFIHSMHTDSPEHAGAMMMDELRSLTAGPTEHGILAGVRIGNRESESARFYFDEPPRLASQ